MYASITESSNNEGALQNGEISTNTFITADLGVGLEYPTIKNAATNEIAICIV